MIKFFILEQIVAEATEPYNITVYRHLCTHALLFKCQHGQDKGATAHGRQMYNTPKKTPGYEKGLQSVSSPRKQIRRLREPRSLEVRGWARL